MMEFKVREGILDTAVALLSLAAGFANNGAAKGLKFAINLARGGNTMVGAHEEHSNIFWSFF